MAGNPLKRKNMKIGVALPGTKNGLIYYQAEQDRLPPPSKPRMSAVATGEDE